MDFRPRNNYSQPVPQINTDVVSGRRVRFYPLGHARTPQNALTKSQNALITSLQQDGFSAAATWAILDQEQPGNKSVLNNLMHVFNDIGGTSGGASAVQAMNGVLWGVADIGAPNPASPAPEELDYLVTKLYTSHNLSASLYHKYLALTEQEKSWIYVEWASKYQFKQKKLEMLIKQKPDPPSTWTYVANCPYYDPATNAMVSCSKGGGGHGGKGGGGGGGGGGGADYIYYAAAGLVVIGVMYVVIKDKNIVSAL